MNSVKQKLATPITECKKSQSASYAWTDSAKSGLKITHSSRGLLIELDGNTTSCMRTRFAEDMCLYIGLVGASVVVCAAPLRSRFTEAPLREGILCYCGAKSRNAGNIALFPARWKAVQVKVANKSSLSGEKKNNGFNNGTFHITAHWYRHTSRY